MTLKALDIGTDSSTAIASGSVSLLQTPDSPAAVKVRQPVHSKPIIPLAARPLVPSIFKRAEEFTATAPHFRTSEQIQADFERVAAKSGGHFTQVEDFDQLATYLAGHEFVSVVGVIGYYHGDAPMDFDLEVLKGAEWRGVEGFLSSPLISEKARRQCLQLQQDLLAADTDRDGILNTWEIAAYTKAHPERYPSSECFRLMAHRYLNTLPAYVTQKDLSDPQISRILGVLSFVARHNEGQGLANKIYIYHGPALDLDNLPDFIQRAKTGMLLPHELVDAHYLLQYRLPDNRCGFIDPVQTIPSDPYTYIIWICPL